MSARDADVLGEDTFVVLRSELSKKVQQKQQKHDTGYYVGYHTKAQSKMGEVPPPRFDLRAPEPLRVGKWGRVPGQSSEHNQIDCRADDLFNWSIPFARAP